MPLLYRGEHCVVVHPIELVLGLVMNRLCLIMYKQFIYHITNQALYQEPTLLGIVEKILAEMVTK